MRCPIPHSCGMFGIWLTIMLFFSGCYSYRVATHALPSTDVTPANTMKAYSLFWGLINKPQVIQTPVCDSLRVNGVAEVRVRTNLGNSLLTICTLGIYCPIRIEWKCAAPCPLPTQPL